MKPGLSGKAVPRLLPVGQGSIQVRLPVLCCQNLVYFGVPGLYKTVAREQSASFKTQKPGIQYLKQLRGRSTYIFTYYAGGASTSSTTSDHSRTLLYFTYNKSRSCQLALNSALLCCALVEPRSLVCALTVNLCGQIQQH